MAKHISTRYHSSKTCTRVNTSQSQYKECASMRLQAANPVPRPRLGHVETIVVDHRKVACDGGLGALGHPRVWLTIGGHQAVCPYCSRLFVLQPDASDAGEH